MSAMTDVKLPHTWRPLGTRLAAVLFGVMLLVLALAVWIAWGPEVRSRFSALQRATIVLLGLMGFAILHALFRCRVTARADGLVVVNGYRSRQFEWAELVAVQLRRGAPFATLDLADGSTVSAWGIQSSDGDRGIRAVRELREVMTDQTRIDRDT